MEDDKTCIAVGAQLIDHLIQRGHNAIWDCGRDGVDTIHCFGRLVVPGLLDMP
jgi:hypothetical protein